MDPLPDLQAWAVFARVAQSGSFAAAARALGMSKAATSKAVARLEARIGATLLNRTSRRLSLTETGLRLADQAGQMLDRALALEAGASADAREPAGLVRIAAPMSFGIGHVAPLVPALLAAYPAISIDLHLSDSVSDITGGGFDLALRIATLADSSLRARRVCQVRRFLVGAPAYVARHGQPAHPRDLPHHACLGYAYLATGDRWQFIGPAEEAMTVRTAGPLRANNGDALLPALLAGLGLAVLPEFTIYDALRAGRLIRLMPDWSPPEIALNIVTPPGLQRATKIARVIEFLLHHLPSAPWAQGAKPSNAAAPP